MWYPAYEHLAIACSHFSDFQVLRKETLDQSFNHSVNMTAVVWHRGGCIDWAPLLQEQ